MATTQLSETRVSDQRRVFGELSVLRQISKKKTPPLSLIVMVRARAASRVRKPRPQPCVWKKGTNELYLSLEIVDAKANFFIFAAFSLSRGGS